MFSFPSFWEEEKKCHAKNHPTNKISSNNSNAQQQATTLLRRTLSVIPLSLEWIQRSELKQKGIK